MGKPKGFDPTERLDRAVTVFWENGFEGIGVQGLCKAMELFPGSLYGTFGDKHQLFLQAFERYVATCSAEGIETLGRGPSGLTAIRSYFAHLVDGIIEGRRRWGCLVTNAVVELGQRDSEIRELSGAHLVRLEQAFLTTLERARAAGEIADEPQQAHALFMVCVVQGLNVLAKTGPSRERLEQITDSAVQSLRPLNA